MDNIHISFHVNPNTGLSGSFSEWPECRNPIRDLKVSDWVSPVEGHSRNQAPYGRTTAELCGSHKGVMDGRDIELWFFLPLN